MLIDILTLFPAMFTGVFDDSIIKKAINKSLLKINILNIRDYSTDRHKNVDDYPYGGDPGMIIKPEPLANAIKSSKKKLKSHSPMVIFLTPQGETLNHSIVRDLHQEKALILICGRYKGIDSRIREKYIDKEISIGDYILSGGEIPAMVLIDSIIRLIPGVLGNEESAECDSFYRGILSPPQYTRPESFEDMNVPNVLLSGHHKKIKEWQQKQAEKITKHRRPDLWEKYTEKMVNK
ncbi:MAG: tRNA (guanosine(37)-N1)-methyltransferase TrmD [Chitinispirillia bacterium]|jgi:tRNA (guanine37-N1)-methyltransferase